jgi:hypothetical protein
MNGIGNKIAEFVFNQLIKQEFLSGKRSYIAGASSILGGVVVLTEMLASGKFDEVRMGVAWAAFTLGYKIIGDAGKADARTQALLTAATKQADEKLLAAEVKGDN